MNTYSVSFTRTTIVNNIIKEIEKIIGKLEGLHKIKICEILDCYKTILYGYLKKQDNLNILEKNEYIKLAIQCYEETIFLVKNYLEENHIAEENFIINEKCLNCQNTLMKLEVCWVEKMLWLNSLTEYEFCFNKEKIKNDMELFNNFFTKTLESLGKNFK